VTAGPGQNETAAAESRSRDRFRVSHADREQVAGALRAAFVQGRLTREELGARAGRVYASRTQAELAEVTAVVMADLPGDLTPAPAPRDPWRATKIAWGIEYALFLPGIVTVLLAPGGPGMPWAAIGTVSAVVYVLFWTLGIAMMIASRSGRRSAGDSERLHASHAVARDQVIRILGAALEQGRLTEAEHETRSAQVPASRDQADLEALVADLPAGLAANPPTARDVQIGVGVIVAAASVLAALVLANPDNILAVAVALLAAAALLVTPVITAGLIADVRHQKRAQRRRR
jgi:DUF1707 SHOCT-like domain